MSLLYYKLLTRIRKAYKSIISFGDSEELNLSPPNPALGTEYLDEIEDNRLAGLAKYSVKSSEQKLETTLKNVNSQFYQAYGPDFSNKTAAHVSVDPPWYYQNLLERILEIPNIVFKTCHDAVTQPPTDDEIICTIRHDVDGDLSAAVQQAQIEHRLGITSSFYLLHNAPYYGVLGDVGGKKNRNTTTFYRHESSLEAYLRIQSLGHELAVHTDGMDYYQRLNTDGASVITTELEWMRENGLIIKGTTAHNSFSVYGCNNYSIFEGRPLSMGTPVGPNAVIHHGKWAPLQVLNEEKLGLMYEANDLFWQDSTPLLYGCLMTQNNWYIAENQYGLLSPETASQRSPLKAMYGTHDDMIDAIRSIKGPAYVKLVVHPMHYGFRYNDRSEPWLAHTPSKEVRKGNGARTWSGGKADGIAGVAINMDNEFNTPDRGLDCYASGDFRIAVLGGKNTFSSTVSSDSKFPQVTARLLRGPIRKPNAVAISASVGTLATDISNQNWKRICAVAVPDILVICYNENDNDTRLLDILSSEYSGPIFILVEQYELALKLKLTELASDNKSIILLDPTQRFEEYNGSGNLTWEDSTIWAPQGHFIVAQILSERIIQQFKSDQ